VRADLRDGSARWERGLGLTAFARRCPRRPTLERTADRTSDGLERSSPAYDRADDRWIKLDGVANLAFGRYQELRLGAPAGCLGRRRRVGRLVVLAPDDRTLLWHCRFDPGTPSPPSAGHCVSSLRRRARRDLSGLRSMGCFSSAALLPRSPSSRGPATGQPSGSRPMELAQRGVRGSPSPMRARLSTARDVLPKRAGEALAAVPQGAGRPRHRRSDRRAGKP
jgi:hypothetical protein